MKTLLVVEDEKNLRMLYEQDLLDEGYHVITAENGVQALEKIKNNKVDLAILDIKMNGMNGVETLKKIMEINKDIKVILNTAYSTYKSDFSTWSADAYLIKTSDLDELKTKVKQLLQ
ncbi:response regulator [candidate division KSB1 bacterium]|nr:response regulator [candidate division KSB1 bacterium]